jgi:hypothetical protein
MRTWILTAILVPVLALIFIQPVLGDGYADGYLITDWFTDKEDIQNQITIATNNIGSLTLRVTSNEVLIASTTNVQGVLTLRVSSNEVNIASATNTAVLLTVRVASNEVNIASATNTTDILTTAIQAYTNASVADAAASVDNSGSTFLQDIAFDDYGHVTGVVISATASVDPVWTNDGAAIYHKNPVCVGRETGTPDYAFAVFGDETASSAVVAEFQGTNAAVGFQVFGNGRTKFGSHMKRISNASTDALDLNYGNLVFVRYVGSQYYGAQTGGQDTEMWVEKGQRFVVSDTHDSTPEYASIDTNGWLSLIGASLEMPATSARGGVSAFTTNSVTHMRLVADNGDYAMPSYGYWQDDETALTDIAYEWHVTNDVIAAVILGDGKFGSGTNAPAFQFHVDGNALIEGELHGKVPVVMDTDNTITLTRTNCMGSVRINADNDAVDYTLDGAFENGDCWSHANCLHAQVITVDAPAGYAFILNDGTVLDPGDAVDSSGAADDKGTFIVVNGTNIMIYSEQNVWADGGTD